MATVRIIVRAENGCETEAHVDEIPEDLLVRVRADGSQDSAVSRVSQAFTRAYMNLFTGIASNG